MNTYQRIFGTGPRGFVVSALLLLLFFYVQNKFHLPPITSDYSLRLAIFCLSIILTLVLSFWSVKSLPPSSRGKDLVTQGASKYFRHPLYASFLLFFNFGLAVYLNSWIYVIWAFVQHPLWHLNVRGEEKLMKEQFPQDYEKYCLETGRFFPVIKRQPKGNFPTE